MDMDAHNGWLFHFIALQLLGEKRSKTTSMSLGG